MPFKCAEKRKAYHKNYTKSYRKKNPKKISDIELNYDLKLKYNITLNDYDELYKRQKGKCLICKVDFLKLDRRPCVDHNHHTGKVRGLLCVKCNTGIGMLNDDLNLLLNAVEYLRTYD